VLKHFSNGETVVNVAIQHCADEVNAGGLKPFSYNSSFFFFLPFYLLKHINKKKITKITRYPTKHFSNGETVVNVAIQHCADEVNAIFRERKEGDSTTLPSSSSSPFTY
jgi:phosphoribosylpyrophosphate synthetase